MGLNRRPRLALRRQWPANVRKPRIVKPDPTTVNCGGGGGRAAAACGPERPQNLREAAGGRCSIPERGAALLGMTVRTRAVRPGCF